MSEAKNDICKIIKEAETDEVLITRHGKPAAIVIGFHSEEDWFDYRLEHDEKFLKKVSKARDEIRNSQFIDFEEL
jgi:prevent-host-death family protein